MSWLRIDDKFLGHAKVATLTEAALLFWFEAALWCSNNSPNGIVPRALLPNIVPRTAKLLRALYPEANPEAALEAAAEELIHATGGGLHEYGLLEEHDIGWEFHDWDDYRGVAVTEATPKQRSEAGRIGGIASAEARKARFGTAQPKQPKHRSTDSEAPGPSRPVPSRPEEEDPAAAEAPAEADPIPQKLPLDFQLHPFAVAELAKGFGQSEAVILAAVQEFKSYWTIGGGMGKRRTHWQAKCRDDVRRKHETGALLAIAKRLGATEEAEAPRKLATLADIDRLLGADQQEPGAA